MDQPLLAPPAQYLRDDAIRGGMDLLMFAHKSHLQRADESLEKIGLGRAHHRVLYVISRRPGMGVGETLNVLQVKKQSLNRVLGSLINRGYVEQRAGEHDRRQRSLWLTSDGLALENQLFEDLRANLARAYSAAGEDAVHGFWMLMQHLMTAEVRQHFSSFYQTPPPKRRC